MNMKVKMKGVDFLKERVKKGFTLIELMVVVMIVGILLVILVGRMTKTMDRSREKTTHKNLKNIKTMDRSREKTTHKNLKNIKVAIDLHAQAPDGGYDYPTSDAEFKAKLNEKFDNNIPMAVLRMGSGVPASNECYVVGSLTARNNEGGWVLVTAGPERGNVYINTTAVDTNGDFYTTYQCW